ncbi:hypothetical protein ACFUC2_05305 [[Kitasatospora] papulosa]|uniref:hypothetical protein n=1 Tax=Streptomyces TaxID=1883 RepID=UPI00331696CD
MTLTDMDTDGRVWIAPVGTAPDDAGAWVHLGYTRDMTSETDDEPVAFLQLGDQAVHMPAATLSPGR